jgi:hypothetical protein
VQVEGIRLSQPEGGSGWSGGKRKSRFLRPTPADWNGLSPPGRLVFWATARVCQERAFAEQTDANRLPQREAGVACLRQHVSQQWFRDTEGGKQTVPAYADLRLADERATHARGGAGDHRNKRHTILSPSRAACSAGTPRDYARQIDRTAGRGPCRLLRATRTLSVADIERRCLGVGRARQACAEVNALHGHHRKLVASEVSPR